VSADIQQIMQSKEAERRRLRALPWLEKLKMPDFLRDRQLLLHQTRPRRSASRRDCVKASRLRPSFGKSQCEVRLL